MYQAVYNKDMFHVNMYVFYFYYLTENTDGKCKTTYRATGFIKSRHMTTNLKSTLKSKILNNILAFAIDLHVIPQNTYFHPSELFL